MIEKIWPSRQDAKRKAQSSVMVADLDALLTERFSFKLLGKVHTIEPFSVQQFALFSKAYYDLTMLSSDDKPVSPEL